MGRAYQLTRSRQRTTQHYETTQPGLPPLIVLSARLLAARRVLLVPGRQPEVVRSSVDNCVVRQSPPCTALHKQAIVPSQLWPALLHSQCLACCTSALPHAHGVPATVRHACSIAPCTPGPQIQPSTWYYRMPLVSIPGGGLTARPLVAGIMLLGQDP